MTATLMPSTPWADNPYEQILKSAQRINWRIEDIIGGDKQLDFSRPFLPESLAQVQAIPGLSDAERLLLNQIRGNSYLHIFGLVEEFIVPAVLDQVRQDDYRDLAAVQALLHFAEEESKHIRLFRRFSEEFEAGFGHRCEGIGPVPTIVRQVMSHQPLGILLIILYIEWMTQHHYLASVRGNYLENLDPQFCSLLRHHWLEEAQHATLDTLMVERLAPTLSAEALQAGLNDFFALLELIHGGLMGQVQLDLASLERATGKSYVGAQRQTMQRLQERAYAWTFIGSGLAQRNFLKTLSSLDARAHQQVLVLAEAYRI